MRESRRNSGKTGKRLADRPAATTAPHGSADDFKLIKGIGPAIERRLHNAGILTFAQLASRSPAAVADLIPNVSAEHIAGQGWIRQASRMARKLAPKERRAKADTIVALSPGRQRYTTFTVELLLREDNVVRRTRVVHIQNGKEAVWAGWEDARLINFFVQQAGLRPQPAEPAPPATAIAKLAEASADMLWPKENYEAPKGSTDEEAKLSTESTTVEPQAAWHAGSPGPELQADLRLEVTGIMLCEILAEPLAEGSGTTKCLRAQIHFQFSGTEANEIATSPRRYFTQILACELASGQIAMLATSQQQPRSNLPDYMATLEFALPEVGRYLVLGMVMLPDDNKAGVALGPVLTVIP